MGKNKKTRTARVSSPERDSVEGQRVPKTKTRCRRRGQLTNWTLVSALVSHARNFRIYSTRSRPLGQHRTGQGWA